METLDELIAHLRDNTGVLTPRLEEAFQTVDRADFVHEDHDIEAYEDYALPIGFGQTISQPTIVALMLSLLDPKKGDRVLDVGCGSGWTTVLIGYFVGEEGEVVAVDRIDEFVELTRNRSSAYASVAPHVGVFNAKEEQAIYSEQFDKILVSASFENEEQIPERMKEGLRDGGRLVAPVGNDLVVYTKNEGKLETENVYPHTVSFVPYLTE